MSSVVFDTSAVTEFAGNHVLRRVVEKLVSADWEVQIPAAVLAEALCGNPKFDVTTHQTLRRINAIDIDVACGKLAGRLRGSVQRSPSMAEPSGVDALVVAFANNADSISVIFTSDMADMQALASWTPQRVAVEPIPD